MTNTPAATLADAYSSTIRAAEVKARKVRSEPSEAEPVDLVALADNLQSRNGGAPSASSASLRLRAAYADSEHRAEALRQERLAALDPTQRDSAAH